MKAKSSEHQERLAAALRKNLKRRKSRDRAPAETELPEPDRRPNKAQKGD